MRNNDPLYDDLNGGSFLGRNVTGVSPWVTDFWFNAMVWRMIFGPIRQRQLRTIPLTAYFLWLPVYLMSAALAVAFFLTVGWGPFLMADGRISYYLFGIVWFPALAALGLWIFWRMVVDHFAQACWWHARIGGPLASSPVVSWFAVRYTPGQGE